MLGWICRRRRWQSISWEYDNERRDELDERYIGTEAWMLRSVTGTTPARNEHPVMIVDNAARNLRRDRRSLHLGNWASNLLSVEPETWPQIVSNGWDLWASFKQRKENDCPTIGQ